MIINSPLISFQKQNGAIDLTKLRRIYIQCPDQF